MPRRSDTSASEGWLSASDIAEYAYCPRAYFYRHHPPPGTPSRESLRIAERGTKFHDGALRSERVDETRRWALVLLGVAASSVIAAGVVWVFL